MKIYFTISFFTILSCLGCGQRDNGDSGTSIDGVELPTCYDINHLKVQVRTTQSLEGGPAFSTLTSDGVPVIYFNEKLMEVISHSAPMVMFVYEHECGHQALGHVQSNQEENDLSKKEHFEQELEADCYAAQQLKARHYLPSSITDIIDDIYPWPKDSEHPSGKVRSRHVSECFNLS